MEEQVTNSVTDIAKEPVLETKEVPLEVKPEEETQDAFSKRFSALNRERKQAEQIKLEAKKLQAQLEIEKQSIEASKKEIEAFRAEQERLKAQELESKDPIEKLQLQVQALQKQLEKEQEEKLKTQKQMLEEESKKTASAAVESIRKKLEATPEFDALLIHGAEGRIYEIISDQYDKTGEILQIDDVAKLLMQQINEQYEKMAKTNLFKSKFANSVQNAAKPEQKTLSNALTAQTPPKENKEKMLTDQERLKRALDAASKVL